MIKSFGHFLAAYLATAVATYGAGHSTIVRVLSYAGYVCHPPAGFYPLDGLSLSGFLAGVLAGFAVHRLPWNRTERVIKDVDVFHIWKTVTLSMLGLIVLYRGYAGITDACSNILIEASPDKIASKITANSVVYSTLNAGVGYLLFDLRRYRFEFHPWRPR